jgi:hypothetical protein
MHAIFHRNEVKMFCDVLTGIKEISLAVGDG